MYDADLELEAELEELMSVLLESDLESENETSEADVACTGCTDRGCFPVLREAIIEAIKLASHAADKIEAAIKVEPGQRNDNAQKTASLFQAFFCHDPSFPVPWARNQPSGATVAARFRAVAWELGPEQRRVRFVCQPTLDDCAVAECCGGDDFAFTPDKHSTRFPSTAFPSTIFLCAKFWDARPPGELGGHPLGGLDDPRLQLVDRRFPGLPEVDRRAGIIIHEMSHMLFDLGDDASPRRFDAHCYVAFALRVNDFGGDPTAVRQCARVPCGGRI
jgi:hypothetical protein